MHIRLPASARSFNALLPPPSPDLSSALLSSQVSACVVLQVSSLVCDRECWQQQPFATDTVGPQAVLLSAASCRVAQADRQWTDAVRVLTILSLFAPSVFRTSAGVVTCFSNLGVAGFGNIEFFTARLDASL